MQKKMNFNYEFLKNAYKSSSCHKEDILSCELSGCFHCGKTFSSSEIIEWIEENNNRGETAICPKCGIDSVLSSKQPIEDEEFLNEMHKYWFKL